MSGEESKEKRLFINMAAQIVSFGVSAGISFFLTPFIVEKLGREAYGFVGLANDFISYAQILVTALNSMASRFITISIHRGENQSANEYFTSLIIANAIITLVLLVPAVLVVLFLDRLLDVPAAILGDVRLLWSLLFLEALAGIAMSVYGSATYVKNRLDLSSKRLIESELLRAGILLAAFSLLPPHVYYLGVSAVVCVTYRTITNIRYTRMLLPEIEVKRSYFRWARIKELLSAGVWNSVTKIGSILSNQLDLLITNLFVGASAMGVVSIAKSLPVLIQAVFSMLASVFMPQLNISYAKGDTDQMRAELIFSIKLLGMIACIPVACVYAFGDVFFSLWVPGQDAKLLQGLAIVAMLASPLGYPLEPLWNVFTVTNKIRQSSLYIIANSFLTIGMVFVLLHFASTDTARMFIIVGVSSVFSIIRGATFLPLYGAKCLNMKLTTFYGPLLKNLAALAVVSAAAFALKAMFNIHTWLGLILVCGTVGITALAVNYFVLLSRAERAMLHTKVKGWLHKT